MKRAKAPGSSGSVVRKLIYSDVDQTRQCWHQAPLICIEDVTNPGIELISVDDRKRRKSCTVRDAKFVIDVTEVHGTLGEIKLAGYLLVRVSLAQRDDDLPLAWGQCLHELWSAPLGLDRIRRQF